MIIVGYGEEGIYEVKNTRSVRCLVLEAVKGEISFNQN